MFGKRRLRSGRMQAPRGAARRKLAVEQLEDRCLPSAMLVADINTDTLDSDPAQTVHLNGMVLFVANDGIHGRELWRTDGTAAGTILLRDINPGSADSTFFDFTVFNGMVFFRTTAPGLGNELWKSDGTPAGTALVKDINPGSAGSAPSFHAVLNNRLYFSATEPVTGRELWQTDGTEAGTVLVKDLNPGAASSSPQNMVVANGRLLFSATVPGAGQELCSSDGTADGTGLLKDVLVGPFGSFPANLTAVGTTLFFTLSNTTQVGSIQLWKSDGTEVGTVLVKVISPSTSVTQPEWFTDVNGMLFFTAATPATGSELWRSDGTEPGTFLVRDIAPGPASAGPPSQLVILNGTLFFRAFDPVNREAIWRSDGTEAGTVPALLRRSQNLTLMGGALFFVSDDPANGTELYRTDGTPAGTVLVRDINPGAGNAFPSWLVNANGTLYLAADDGVFGTELWRSDGTTAGTRLVRDINVHGDSADPNGFIATTDRLYFAARDGLSFDPNLWRTDGTPAGTTRVIDAAASGFVSPFPLAVIGSVIFFTANSPAAGVELWRTDGTPAGTFLLRDIAPGTDFSNINQAVVFNGSVYFAARNATFGTELWKSDGTTVGTVMVRDIYPGLVDSFPTNLTVYNGQLLFTTSSPNGIELWKTDGTTDGTIVVQTISPTAMFVNPPSSFRRAGADLFFLATTPAAGTELWKTNGTAAGTLMVRDINPGPGNSFPTSLTDLGGRLYFGATDGFGQRSLWISDGTEDGTGAIRSMTVDALAAVGDTLFISTTLDGAGRELWKSDGTDNFALVRDINPGVAGSDPTLFRNLNGLLIFSANDGTNGREMWQSDGTEEGTVLVTDILPGSGTSTPILAVVGPGALFFSADDGMRGRELWKINAPAADLFQFSAAGTTVGEGSGTATITVTRTGSIGGPVTLFFTTSMGTAAADLDYTTTSGTLTFAAGQMSATITVPILEDNIFEGNETVYLTLANPTRGGALGPVSEAVLTIVDNDPVMLVVTSFTPTTTGFVVDLSQSIFPDVLNLYDTQADAFGPADVTLVGSTTGAVRGSLLINSAGNRLTFIRTGGILPADTYTVTLRTGPNAIRTPSGALLDGNRDGTTGDNYTNTFRMGSFTSFIVGIPDFARGPGQPVNLPATASGLPVRISVASGIRSVRFTLRYNPALLQITGAVLAGGLPAGASVTLSVPTPGTALFNFTSPTGLTGLATDLARLTATVPDDAPYPSKHVLDITDLLVEEGAQAAFDDDALHVAGYLGDTTGNGNYSAADATRALRVAVGLDSGFSAYRQTDPLLIADVVENGLINATDATRILQQSVGIDQSAIPPLPPNPPSIVMGGPDPRLSIATPLPVSPLRGQRGRGEGNRVRPGRTIAVPLLLDVSDGLESADLALSYDPAYLEVVAVRRGRLTADFDLFAVNRNSDNGTLRAGMGRTKGPITGRGSGSILIIVFRIKPDAPAGKTIINLRRSVGASVTRLNEGGLTLGPAPDDQAGDELDGVIEVYRSKGRSLFSPNRVASRPTLDGTG